MIEPAYQLADDLADKGDKATSLIVGRVAGLAEQRGRIIERLASVCYQTSKAKRDIEMRRILADFSDEDALSFSRLLYR